MVIASQNLIDIHEIIENKRIVSFFQPLVSVHKKKIVGYEALSRGLNGDHVIQPAILFSEATTQNLLGELNQICIEKALETFSWQKQGQTFLSINCETTLITEESDNLQFILDFIDQFGLNHSSIVLEILESKISNTDAVLSFIQQARQHGLLIALDDFGKGHSNLDRITLIKPDILKLDRSLIQDIHHYYHKQQTVKSIVNLSHKFGTVVIAEGIECEEESIYCLELGADILQGYYFAYPANPAETEPHASIQPVIEETASNFKKFTLNKFSNRMAQFQHYDTVISHLIYEFSRISHEKFESRLVEWINNHPSFECIYILNDKGMQITDTILNKQQTYFSRNQTLFSPAPKGTDHSIKQYFFFVMTGMKKYVSEPYISLASGHLCITITFSFINNGETYVFCVDLDTNSSNCFYC